MPFPPLPEPPRAAQPFHAIGDDAAVERSLHRLAARVRVLRVLLFRRQGAAVLEAASEAGAFDLSMLCGGKELLSGTGGVRVSFMDGLPCWDDVEEAQECERGERADRAQCGLVGEWTVGAAQTTEPALPLRASLACVCRGVVVGCEPRRAGPSLA